MRYLTLAAAAVAPMLSFATGTVASTQTSESKPMNQPVVISIYQGVCQEGDFNTNLATVRAVVREAQERGSHFVAFPETFLSGYESAAAVQRGARPLDDPALQAFIAESAAHDMVVLVGLARVAGTQLFNSVLVIQRGALLGIYDKIMLTPGDRDALGFAPGTAIPVWEAHGIRFAVNICADTSYPFPAMAAKLQGAQLLFTPHNNEIVDFAADDHRRWVRNCHIGLACQLQLAVARANNVKSDRPGQIGYGDSFILNPQGTPLAEAKLFKTALITATLTPEMFASPYAWGNIYETPAWLRTQVARQLTEFRTPTDEAELRYWLENMAVYHRFTPDEISMATGLTPDEAAAALRQFGLAGKAPAPRAAGAPLRVLPYPGGRHPRSGFFEGAVMPQRETKISVFTPWDDASYVVVDVPEAIFSNLELLYLAHEDANVKSVWAAQGIALPRLEWQRHADGTLTSERTLPNGVAFGTRVTPGTNEVRMELWLRNGTAALLTGLRVQNCVMLRGAAGFDRQTNSNKVVRPPVVAVQSADGTHWMLTAWSHCQRCWCNPPLPCIHSDPQFPDCKPGATVRVRGVLAFVEGKDATAEMQRLGTLVAE